MDLRTRYTALVTLITQYVKFASETLKRTEDEEVTRLFNTPTSLLWSFSLQFNNDDLHSKNVDYLLFAIFYTLNIFFPRDV